MRTTGFAVVVLVAGALAQDKGADGAGKPYAPRIVAASDEPLRTMRGFKIPDGFTIDCFAAEPRVAQPVSFWIARNGDCYVAESFRHHAGVTDIRDHMDWLDDDVAARSVEDRVAMYRKHLGDAFPTYETEHERVRLLRDKDGDGRADFDVVFADGFHHAADGIGAGLLEHHGDVYYTCIPDLWLLRDDDKDGRAEKRTSMSTGWGIRVALLGHDMHGLQIGPDGKLYWSIGDRGFRVTTKEGGLLDSPYTGAVLRSNLDGSDMEVFATGLRNPQELAFDDFGNLWTGDNNSDGGDLARWVHVVEAGETGWRQAYQWLVDPHARGPWNDERLWVPHFDGQAAYVVPPLANVGNGPSGLACYPGTGLPDAYRGRFFLCNFSGGPEWSGVYTFGVTPKGASYAVGAIEKFVWRPLATDCDFGLDGGLYVSDWVEGWNKTGKGRIWRVFEKGSSESEIVKSTRDLLKSGMKKRSPAELATLLAHADRRVRQDAHLELASRGSEGFAEIDRVARDVGQPLLARLHAAWALGVAHALDPNLPKGAAGVLMTAPGLDPRTNMGALGVLMADPDPEIRAQAARVAGDRRLPIALDPFIKLLRDPSLRVRLHAAIGLARLRNEKAVEPVLALIREVGEHDPHLRHAATYALWSCATPEKIAALASDPSVDVRVACVVALRRLESPAVARFLEDDHSRVRAEAARAIYDVPIAAALPALADLIQRDDAIAMDVRVPISAEKDAFQAGNGLVRRILNANFRLGGTERAQRLASFAANAKASERARTEALDLLALWRKPPGRDAFHGEWMPLPERDPAAIEAASRALGKALTDETPVDVLRAWIRLAARAGSREACPRLTSLALDGARDESVRAQALEALGTLRPDGVLDTLKKTLFDSAPAVRAASLAAFQSIAPDEALPLLENALSATLAERRVAYSALAKLALPRVDELLARELERLKKNEVPPEAALDLVIAAETRGTEPLKKALVERAEPRKIDEKTARYLDSLAGGDAAKGRDVFRGKSQLECLRCHMAEGEGGVVGPHLKEVKKRLTRLQMLESIVDPNRAFSPGYQGTVVFRWNGPPVEGLVLLNAPDRVKLQKSDGSIVEIPKPEIEMLQPGLSAMPTNHAEHLSREEMRDLIEYLDTL